MKIGYVTHYGDETLRTAARLGFDCVEVFTDINTKLDLTKMTDDDFKKVREDQEKTGITFATVSNNVNHLDADPAKRKENNRYFIKGIETCGRFGTDIIMTNVWGNREIPPMDNLKVFREVFSEYARVAEANGVRIAVENCPHSWGYPITIGNICYSPEMWEAMFDAVPSKALGLEYDPSHLCWLMIDYIGAIQEFGDRIFAMHAKDTEILYDKLGRSGIFGVQIHGPGVDEAGWWRYRIPGWGEIDWKGIFVELSNCGFCGPVLIEHEDPVFGGARTEEGLALGLQYLKTFRRN
jgi:sugar phosphate isomerase/epimerase